MNLSIAVQHHPLRAHLIEPLLARLGEAEVVVDPEPDSPVRSPLRTYIECLRWTPPDATHRLIVQDDAWPVDDFRARAEACIGNWPDALVALFLTGTGGHRKRVKRALEARVPWVALPMAWTPTVALAWPQAAVQGFLAYSSRYDLAKTRGDDGPVGAYRQEAGLRCFAPIPSLVEHPDVEPSIFRSGKKAKAGAAGRNRARVAALYGP